MWQITWMLSLLPDWFWTLVLVAGVLAVLAAWVLKFVPFIATYRLPIQVGGILALVVGVYFQGVIANEEKWQARIKELEEKIQVAETKAKEINTQVEEKIVYKDKIIKEKGQKQIVYVDKIVKGDTVEITKDMSETERLAFKKKQEELELALKNCPVPQLVIEEHNKAAVKEINKLIQENKK